MSSRWARGFHETEGYKLHYWRTGGRGKRPLVLVHGFSDNGLCWTPVARELESDFDVIMPDMLGHGLSSRARPGQGIDMASYLASLIRGLGLSRPILAGHSMGAMISARVAASYPGIASALALEDPPWFAPGSPPGSGPGEEGTPPIVAWAKGLEAATIEELLSGYRRDHPSWPDELVRIMCESKKQLDPGIIDRLDFALRSEGSDWSPVLRLIAVPLLLITGDPSLGAIVEPGTAARVREIKPDTEVVKVPGAGHLIRFDEPRAFMGALRPFLDRIRESGT
jgi:N-formylmaleamate deformylase